jgi:hypothetical protein
MPANTSPIFSGVGDIEWAPAALNTANTLYDGTGPNGQVIFTAGPSGSFVQRIRFKASGSTAATAGRIFINNGSDTGSAVNNVLFDEVTLAAQTATNTGATSVFEIPMNVALPPNYRLIATVAVVQPSGGWYVSAIGGSYAAI